MTKYTSNEQYEKDKERLINILIGGGVEDFTVNMLKQSKWSGADEAATQEKNVKKETKGGFFWDDDDDDSDFWAV